MTQSRDRAVRVGSAVVIAICLLLFGRSVALLLRPAAVNPSRTDVRGQRIDINPAAYRESPHTLLLFMRDSCIACTDAEPFLKSLIDRLGPAMLAGQVRVVFPAKDLSDPNRLGYIRRLGFDQSAAILSASTRSRTVPSVVLVDRAGLIGFSAAGIPALGRLDEFFAEIIAQVTR